MDGKPGCDSREGEGDGWRESHDVMQGVEQGWGKDPKREWKKGKEEGPLERRVQDIMPILYVVLRYRDYCRRNRRGAVRE